MCAAIPPLLLSYYITDSFATLMIFFHFINSDGNFLLYKQGKLLMFETIQPRTLEKNGNFKKLSLFIKKKNTKR